MRLSNHGQATWSWWRSLAATVAVDPHAAGTALGQASAGDLRRAVVAPPKPIGAAGRGRLGQQGGVARERLTSVRRYRFSVKEKGTAYVYVGDQWYDLNLGLYSLKSGADVGCWQVQVEAPPPSPSRIGSASCARTSAPSRSSPVTTS